MKSTTGIGVVLATIIVAAVVGFGVPLGWVWIGSQVQGGSGASNLDFSVAMLIFFGIIVTYALRPLHRGLGHLDGSSTIPTRAKQKTTAREPVDAGDDGHARDQAARRRQDVGHRDRLRRHDADRHRRLLDLVLRRRRLARCRPSEADRAARPCSCSRSVPSAACSATPPTFRRGRRPTSTTASRSSGRAHCGSRWRSASRPSPPASCGCGLRPCPPRPVERLREAVAAIASVLAIYAISALVSDRPEGAGDAARS